MLSLVHEIEELHHHRARVGILLGQRHVEAKEHDEVLEKQDPAVRLEGKTIVDDLDVTYLILNKSCSPHAYLAFH